jgi:hypothetical protein
MRTIEVRLTQGDDRRDYTVMDLKLDTYDVDTRITTDLKDHGPNLYYPYGLVWTHRKEWDTMPIHIDGPVGVRVAYGVLPDGWSSMTDYSGEPIMKFLMEPRVSNEYQIFECYSYGKLWRLETRIKSVYV